MDKCKRIIRNHLLQPILKLIRTSNKLTKTNIKIEIYTKKQNSFIILFKLYSEQTCYNFNIKN